MIAVGADLGALREDGSRETTPVVLRYAAGSWREVSLPAALTGFLSAVVFASALDAWAIGQAVGQQPLLLRSRDGGASWADVSWRVPTSPYFDLTWTSIAFAGAFGTIAAQTPSGMGPFLAHTEDRGDSWSPFVPHEPTQQFSAALATRGDEIVLLRNGWQRTVIETPSVAHGQYQAAATVGEAVRHGLIGAAVGVAGADTWVAGHRAVSHSGPSATQAAIVRVSGDVVAHENILCPIGGYLTAIDVASPVGGVAGGVGHTEEGDVPLLVYRDGAESRWICTVVEGDLGGMAVRGVVLGAGDEAWAVGHGHGVRGALLLASFDGGRRWSRLPTPIDDDGQLFAVARAPDGEQ